MVAQIAAPLCGVDKDTIVGEHLTLQRRGRRGRYRAGHAANRDLTGFEWERYVGTTPPDNLPCLR
jgi:hypothetical protein